MFFTNERLKLTNQTPNFKNWKSKLTGMLFRCKRTSVQSSPYFLQEVYESHELYSHWSRVIIISRVIMSSRLCERLAVPWYHRPIFTLVPVAASFYSNQLCRTCCLLQLSYGDIININVIPNYRRKSRNSYLKSDQGVVRKLNVTSIVRRVRFIK